MDFIEGLILSIEKDISGKREIYNSISNDLNEKQIASLKEELKQIKELLEKAKYDFRLEENKFPLSRLITVRCTSIWEALEDLYSKRLEKSSGKISSQEKKEKLDNTVRELYKHTSKIMSLVKK